MVCGLATFASAGQASADGSFFGALKVDGPSAALGSIGGLEMAPDGTAALLFVRNVDGANHVFMSSVVAGEPQAAERVDVGQPALIGRPVVGVADGGRLVVLFANSGGVWARMRTAPGEQFQTAQKLDGNGAVQPTVDMTSLTGVAYAGWSHDGKVRAAYLPRRASSFTVYSGAANISSANDAGSGASLAPKVSTAADGIGIVAFGERVGDTTKVAVRRLVRDRLSNIVTSVGATEIAGNTGLAASFPEVVIEDDSSYAWLAFKQNFSDGVTRAVARRLRASTLESASALADGAQIAPGTTPDLALSGRGAGIASVQAADGWVWSSLIRDDALAEPARMGSSSTVFASPGSTFAPSEDGVTAWMQGDAGELYGRRIDDDPDYVSAPPFSEGKRLSAPAFGAVDPSDGLALASDRDGNVLISFTQGEGAAKQVVVASYDVAPDKATLINTPAWRNSPAPELRWRSPPETWAGLYYRVYLDGALSGETSSPRTNPSRVLSDGLHSWRVDSYDRRGQKSVSAVATLRIDTRPPRVQLRATAGGAIKVAAVDPAAPKGSGIASLRLDYGDGSRPTTITRDSLKVKHRFRRSGRVTVVVTAIDKAGNAQTVRRTVNAG